MKNKYNQKYSPLFKKNEFGIPIPWETILKSKKLMSLVRNENSKYNGF
jgi:hypothetical protein